MATLLIGQRGCWLGWDNRNADGGPHFRPRNKSAEPGTIRHFVMAIISAEVKVRHTATPQMPMTVLICGSPASGFQIIGLFANSADAQSYAEDYSLKDWRVAELISPEAFAESQVATASKSHL